MTYSLSSKSERSDAESPLRPTQLNSFVDTVNFKSLDIRNIKILKKM